MTKKKRSETLRITPPNSERPGHKVGRGWGALILTLTCGMLLGGCAERTQPAQFFALSPESSANRAMQTRFFETGNDHELLSASAASLQDLGFQIEESVREVGLLRAAKERSAREYGQYCNLFLIRLVSLGHLVIPIDLHQKIAATIVIRPANQGDTRREVRIMFYRVIWKGDGQADRNYIPPGEQRMEMVRDPEIYQQFFAKLSKAVFLEPHSI